MIQNAVFEGGKRHACKELRAWFGCLYQVLLGQQEGPRFGGFVALYGIPETVALIQAALARAPAIGPSDALDRAPALTPGSSLAASPVLAPGADAAVDAA